MSNPLTRKLSYGVYDATDAFSAIEKHSCVCFADNMGLVAVTGRAGDELSEAYAELFAMAPDMANTISELRDALAAEQEHSAALQAASAGYQDDNVALYAKLAEAQETIDAQAKEIRILKNIWIETAKPAAGY